ncbi:MAG: aromatic-L-amino-acid decarboxylase [Acidimicrobiales bacterium]|jgi:aromatic-L-amino-acid/L-tryptophan decarboxylase
MTSDEFREAGHALIDWIADYRASIDALPVLAQVEPGDVRAALPAIPPTGAEPFADVMADLDRVVLPGVTNVQHPMHFGWFPSNASLSSVLGDMASSGIGSLGISWESCPSLTEVEEVVCDWMRQLVGLSAKWSGTIQDTASSACVVALLAGRERAGAFSEATGGLQSLGAPLVVYTTDQSHSSVVKAASIAGFGLGNVRLVSTDPWTRSMDVAELESVVRRDIADGYVPAVVVASVGTTGTTAFDPLSDIVAVLDRLMSSGDCSERPWLHVDAAMAGSAMILPDYRWMWEGVESADSISLNPHKWLGTILDTSLFYVRDPEHLIRVLSTNPSYLQSAADGQVVQYRDWGIPLGRRFRALKLWFHLRLDGPDAIALRLRRDLANAAWLVEQIESEPGWQVVAPVPLQTVCVRHIPNGPDGEPLSGEALEAHTTSWAAAINRSGRAYVTPSQLDGSWMVRVSIGVEATEREHVEVLWGLMKAGVA